MKEIMEHTQGRNVSKLLSSQRLKKMTQILLSVSIFSFLFSYYNSLYSSSPLKCPRNLHYFPSNNAPFTFSSRAMNKSYIFLICNGLLVFLSKTSGLLRCSSGFDFDDLLHKRANGESCLQMYNSLFAPKVEEETLKDETRQVSIVIAEEEDHEDAKDEEEMLSDEELNQKCEEFIRRMKEEIVIDGARELVIFK